MRGNRVIVLSAALGFFLLGCGNKDSAEPARTPAAAPPSRAAATPTRTPAPSSTRHAASKRPAKSTSTATTTTRSTLKTTATKTSSGLVLRVPEAHLPPPGQCRIWNDGKSPFQQPQPQSCDGIMRAAPANSMILDRPEKDTKIVRVRYIGAHAGQVVRVRLFDGTSGKYLRDGRA